MITVHIKGGLGNQLFQYASAYALSRNLQQSLCLDTSFYPKQALRGYKLGNLDIDKDIFTTNICNSLMVRVINNKYVNKLLRIEKFSVIPVGKNKKLLLESTKELVRDFFTITGTDIYMDGYFQSEEYFSKYREEICKQFVPIYDLEQEYLLQLKEIEECNSIAVHVRRGDFISAQKEKVPLHYLLGRQYYQRALECINECIENPVFFWFSDDIDWVKQNFGEKENFRFVGLRTKHADIDEMMLMKNCKHIITANSTFSWWASWLNENKEAMHICPEKRYGNVNMIPDNWIKIAVE